MAGGQRTEDGFVHRNPSRVVQAIEPPPESISYRMLLSGSVENAQRLCADWYGSLRITAANQAVAMSVGPWVGRRSVLGEWSQRFAFALGRHDFVPAHFVSAKRSRQ